MDLTRAMVASRLRGLTPDQIIGQHGAGGESDAPSEARGRPIHPPRVPTMEEVLLCMPRCGGTADPETIDVAIGKAAWPVWYEAVCNSWSQRATDDVEFRVDR
jgi:hypothetical protein